MKKYFLAIFLGAFFVAQIDATTLWMSPAQGSPTIADHISVGTGAGNSGTSLNSYFSFVLTPDSGFQINFASFSYTGGTGTGDWGSFAFLSSVDNFSSNIGSPNAAGTKLSLTGSQFQGLTGPIEFRLYGFDPSRGFGAFSISNFAFTGSVDAPGPVPESSPGLVGFVSAFLMFAVAARRFGISNSSRPVRVVR